MKATVHDARALRSVLPDDIRQYLSGSGWTQITASQLAAVYDRRLDGVDYEILVPLSPQLRDFPERISEILQTLEVVEKRDQLQILIDLTSARADVVRIRRPAANDGTIPLLDGVSLINSASEMVLAAACTTIAPRLYYPSRKPTAATEYLKHTRLGQSERGSYVVTVISPLPPRTGDELFPGMHDPFERQVTRMLQSALEATVQASEEALRRGNPDHFRESVQQGVSANLLDSVLGLMGPYHQEVDVNIAWSPEHPITFGPGTRVSIVQDFAPVIEEASRFLKRNAEQPPLELVGMVVGLRRPEGAETGRATLVAFIGGRPKTVNIELAQHDYDLAIQAHQLHRTVMCEGVLVRMGRAAILTNMTNFRVAPELEEEQDQTTLF